MQSKTMLGLLKSNTAYSEGWTESNSACSTNECMTKKWDVFYNLQ